MCHESWRHSISPISAVPLQQAHITMVTKSHRAVNDTHIYIQVFGTMRRGHKQAEMKVLKDGGEINRKIVTYTSLDPLKSIQEKLVCCCVCICVCPASCVSEGLIIVSLAET